MSDGFPSAPAGTGPYTALVGDLRGSRRLPDERRAEVQRKLEQAIGEIERALSGGAAPDRPAPLASRLEVTAGDEFQGLLRESWAAVPIVQEVADRMHPVAVGFGLGRGAVTTDLRPEPGRMDGPAFHRAREAVERARRERVLLAAGGFGEPWDEVIGALFQLAGHLHERWTERQRQFVLACWEAVGDVETWDRRFVDLRYRPPRGVRSEVATRFGVSPSTVSQSLAAAGFDAFAGSLHAAAALLQRLDAQAETT